MKYKLTFSDEILRLDGNTTKMRVTCTVIFQSDKGKEIPMTEYNISAKTVRHAEDTPDLNMALRVLRVKCETKAYKKFQKILSCGYKQAREQIAAFDAADIKCAEVLAHNKEYIKTLCHEENK